MTAPTARSLRAGCLLALSLASRALAAPALQVVWPTPNHAWIEGRPISAWVQPTESGVDTSGLFGGVRSGGTQFHEGLDIRPILPRDRSGEPTDPVFAFADGIVRYVNARPGESSYGRYIVLEHPQCTPAVYSLYAHLRLIEPGIAPGVHVKCGATLGGMGHSSGGYTIPRDRAHMHFELGLQLTTDFQPWYDEQRFGSPNEHGSWNGMNLAGLDPLEFLNDFRAAKVQDFGDYFAQQPVLLRVRVATTHRPDFADRYPSLVAEGDGNLMMTGGWELALGPYELPVQIKPLPASEFAGYKTGEVRVVACDAEAVRACLCKQFVIRRRGTVAPGRDTMQVVQLIFGLR